MNNQYLTESKIAWLSNKIYDLLWKEGTCKYTKEQIYEALNDNIYEHSDEHRYKILAALVYQKNIDQLKNELNSLIKE